VAGYYYLRIIVIMYMHEQAEATVWFSALGTLVLGIFPSLILNFAGNSALLAR
jgi:NADH:ubiquinone oxidoreductase subunit 2 (subunit N)